MDRAGFELTATYILCQFNILVIKELEAKHTAHIIISHLYITMNFARRALCKFAGAMFKLYKSRPKFTIKVRCLKSTAPLERSGHKEQICQLWLQIWKDPLHNLSKYAISLCATMARILWGAVLLFIRKMWYHLAFDVISPWLLCDITLELSDITNWTKWYHLIIKVISHNCDNLVISPRVWSDIT